MTTLSLDKIYKKYPNATQYAVEDFNIDIKNSLYSLVLQVVVNQQHCEWSLVLKILPKVNLKLTVKS